MILDLDLIQSASPASYNLFIHARRDNPIEPHRFGDVLEIALAQAFQDEIPLDALSRDRAYKDLTFSGLSSYAG